MTRRRRMNRRFWLKSAGGLALAAPFLPSLWQRLARGQPAPLPRRSVIFATPNGCLTNRWFPKVEHGALDAASLQGTTLEVLTPFIRKLLVPRGLRAVNGFGKPQRIDPHDQAMAAKLTCALMDTEQSHYALSHSLDHEIARQLNPSGRPPMVLSVGNVFLNVKALLSYSAPRTPMAPTTNPLTVYQTLGGLVTGGSGELEVIRRRRLSVIDAVRDDLQSYQRLDMSAADKRRVSTWLDLLRESERGLAAGSCSLGAVGTDDAAVEAASASPANALAFTAGADMMFKLIALTMLCDANRSFLFSFPPAVTFRWDGIQHTVDHDGLGHRSGSSATGGMCYPGVLGMLAEIDRWFAGKFAKLVGLLDSLPEGSGSVLDNTATMWIQEFSDGNVMNVNNLPVLIAGSAGGYLKQGVAVNVEGQPIGPGNSEACCMEGGTGMITFNTGSTGGNVPISKLYVTLLNALGCKAQDGGPVTTFGMLDGVNEGDGILDPGELTALKA
jgi:uncharacterized protein DUF1552